MAMIMSYLTRTRGIIVLLKTLPQYGKLTKKKKKITRSQTIFAEHGIARIP